MSDAQIRPSILWEAVPFAAHGHDAAERQRGERKRNVEDDQRLHGRARGVMLTETTLSWCFM